MECKGLNALEKPTLVLRVDWSGGIGNTALLLAKRIKITLTIL